MCRQETVDSSEPAGVLPGQTPHVSAGGRTWGGLDYSCVEPDCDQKFVLTFERPFELEFLGVRNSGKPTVSATRDGTALPCSLRVVDATGYEVRFTPPLRLDAKTWRFKSGASNAEANAFG